MNQQNGPLTYAAVIGDIKDSRTLSNREAVQERFRSVLQSINQTYAEDIAAEFVITLGDSFQGLVKNKRVVLTILFEIELAMSPVEFRFGIGLGEISTPIQRENSSGMDGAAYHRARQMIDTIEANEAKYATSETNAMICSGTGYQANDSLLNAVLSLGTALKSKWTQRQKEIMYTYFLHGENQYKTADALNIGQSSVNKALNAAKYYTYKTALSDASLFLAQLDKEELA
ncbi:SatD family protein [Desemzia incerta]|uniref:SatD family protein n=1 Tax=Desemzia incerta TaxID=82801 RepID=UPI0024C2EFBB|nr:SatD family protein [Desemzia incerta]WHZ31655.1 SatD family protein [Desemzia incerta]